MELEQSQAEKDRRLLSFTWRRQPGGLECFGRYVSQQMQHGWTRIFKFDEDMRGWILSGDEQTGATFWGPECG